MIDPARLTVGMVFAVALSCGCGRRAELDADPNARSDGGGGAGGLLFDAPAERITPDGPVPVVEDAGLSLEAGDGCAARPIGCPSLADFPCGKSAWFSQLIDTCRAQAGCVKGFLTIRLEGEGCASEIGMTDENRRFVECLVADLEVKRCPCAPSLETRYLGAGC